MFDKGWNHEVVTKLNLQQSKCVDTRISLQQNLIASTFFLARFERYMQYIRIFELYFYIFIFIYIRIKYLDIICMFPWCPCFRLGSSCPLHLGALRKDDTRWLAESPLADFLHFSDKSDPFFVVPWFFADKTWPNKIHQTCWCVSRVQEGCVPSYKAGK